LLVVAVVCAIVPYFLVRDPITRIVHSLRHKPAGPAHPPAASTNEDTKGPDR
jgi:hypothetical protein